MADSAGVVRSRGRSDAGADAGTARHLRLWAAAAVLVLVASSVGAVFAARAVARNNADRSRREFATSAAQVASTLELAIQHEDDLVVNAGAYVVQNPTSTNAQFAAWTNVTRLSERYPEMRGIGFVRIVTASELPAFVLASPLAADGQLQVIPPGDRAYYCLGTFQKSSTNQTAAPPGLDVCAGTSGAALLAARDSGRGVYSPITIKGVTLLSVQAPVYRGGVVPATVQTRRDAFAGWVGLGADPKVVLDRALLGHSTLAVSFRYRQGASNVVFRSGKVPSGATAVVTSLHNGWTVTTFGQVDAGGVFANGSALTLLLAGIVLSVLLAALLFVLATGRARALRQVQEKTGQLRHQALHDALTGLPNRALITDRIEQLLARNRRNGTLGAALYVDLDGFKDVNDTLGHAAGDRLLQAVAERLTTTLRDADTIGRMGGDEFVVLIDGASLEVAPELVAERVLEVMRQPFVLEESPSPMVVTTSVGIAVGDRKTPGDLLRDADVALYQAKAAGKNCYVIFRAEMETSVQHRYELEFDLRAALAGDQFRLVYQPIYNLDDLTIIGVEALLRWDHPSLGEIQPDEFIPLLESSGQIIDVGRWVLLEACRQMQKWRARGSDLIVSVNVSGRQLDRDSIVDHIREALRLSGLDPASLTIEVTETALMRNIESTARRLGELKALGVEIAIDDFGTGYSSLAYLQKFPVDCLKIDRTFTNAINKSPEANALIHTLVQLGKDLGLRTLAEGVETTGEVDQLRAQDVTQAQGFLMARPLTPQDFEKQLLEPARPALVTPTPRI